MAEYWLKYGNVEIPVEIDDEVRVEKISIEPNIRYDHNVISRLIDELADNKSISIVYDHSSSKDLELLRSFLAELEARGFEDHRIKLLASSWRIDGDTLEEVLGEALKSHRGGIVYPWSEDKVELKNVKVSRSIAEASSRVIVTSIIPHGVIGIPSLRESLLLNKWITGIEDVDAYRSILEDELRFLGLVIGGDTIYSGDIDEVEEECRRKVEKTYTVKIGDVVEMVLVDAGGWPWDSTLESSLHMVGLVSQTIVEGGLIGLVAECRKALGSVKFVEALFSQNASGDTLSEKILKMVRELAEVKKLALVTTIPRSVLDKTLNARGFDTPQELLTYGFRMYSKQAKVRIVSGYVKLTR
ncbi:MAG: hypothetical protein ABDH32_06395 [Candidatus Caldarchaeales archaeon]